LFRVSPAALGRRIERAALLRRETIAGHTVNILGTRGSARETQGKHTGEEHRDLRLFVDRGHMKRRPERSNNTQARAVAEAGGVVNTNGQGGESLSGNSWLKRTHVFSFRSHLSKMVSLSPKVSNGRMAGTLLFVDDVIIALFKVDYCCNSLATYAVPTHGDVAHPQR